MINTMRPAIAEVASCFAVRVAIVIVSAALLPVALCVFLFAYLPMLFLDGLSVMCMNDMRTLTMGKHVKSLCICPFVMDGNMYWLRRASKSYRRVWIDDDMLGRYRSRVLWRVDTQLSWVRK